YLLTATLALLAAAWLANWITKRLVLRGLERAVRVFASDRIDQLPDHNVVARLSNIVPALVLWFGVGMIQQLPEVVVIVVRNVCSAFIVLTIALALGGVLNLVNDIYQRRPEAANRPIKGYLEVIKIIIYVVAAILVVAALIDR